MAGSPERRAALVDAGVEVLARQGARGLTFRAVDAEAGVPVGTASDAPAPPAHRWWSVSRAVRATSATSVGRPGGRGGCP